MTWAPPEPVVIAGYTMRRDEAGRREFKQDWFPPAHGEADEEKVADQAIEMVAQNDTYGPWGTSRYARNVGLKVSPCSIAHFSTYICLPARWHAYCGSFNIRDSPGRLTNLEFFK